MREDGLATGTPGEAGWLAEEAGKLRRPPNEHVLDFLVRQRIIYTDDLFQSLPEYWSHLDEPGTVAMLEELPTCNICEGRERKPRLARYDAGLAAGGGIWAYLCEACFAEQGPKRLGMGRGQYLMTPEEVPADLWKRFELAKTVWDERLASIRGGGRPS